MAYKVAPGICPSCNTSTGSNSGSESWHEACFQEHLKVTKGVCNTHNVCKRMLYLREAVKRSKKGD